MAASKTIVRWLVRPIAAATVSLAAVSLFTALLGIVFLPAEIQTVRQVASVTHSLELSDGAVLSLVWSMPSGYGGGRKFHLAFQCGNGANAEFAWPELKPLSLAKGPGVDQVVVGSWDGWLHLLDFARGTSEPLRGGRRGEGIIALATSADGQCVVSQGAFDLRAWDLAGKHDRWRRTDVAPFCFALAPDSQTAFVANREGEVLQIDLHSGRTLRSLARVQETTIQFAVSPGGDSLAILGATGRLLTLDTASGQPRWEQSVRFFAHQAPARVAAFSPSGQLLVTSDHERGNALVVWDAATGQRLRELRGHRRIVHGAEFANSGELRSWGADGTIRVWDLNTGETISVLALDPPLNAT